MTEEKEECAHEWKPVAGCRCDTFQCRWCGEVVEP